MNLGSKTLVSNRNIDKKVGKEIAYRGRKPITGWGSSKVEQTTLVGLGYFKYIANFAAWNIISRKGGNVIKPGTKGKAARCEKETQTTESPTRKGQLFTRGDGNRTRRNFRVNRREKGGVRRNRQKLGGLTTRRRYEGGGVEKNRPKAPSTSGAHRNNEGRQRQHQPEPPPWRVGGRAAALTNKGNKRGSFAQSGV